MGTSNHIPTFQEIRQLPISSSYYPHPGQSLEGRHGPSQVLYDRKRSPCIGAGKEGGAPPSVLWNKGKPRAPTMWCNIQSHPPLPLPSWSLNGLEHMALPSGWPGRTSALHKHILGLFNRQKPLLWEWLVKKRLSGKGLWFMRQVR